MREHSNNFKRNVQTVYRLLIICISTAVIILLYPNIGNFKYEFHKGTPWKHETLIAPFDFAIYKSDKEFSDEKLEILKNYSPYFTYNDSIDDNYKNKFLKHFDKQWTNFLIVSHSKKDSLQLDKLKKPSIEVCKNALIQIYERGIISNTNNFFQENPNIQKITIVKNNIAEKNRLSDIFTPKSAYSFFLGVIDEKIENKAIKAYVKKLNINSFLYPNLSFDKKKSEQYKEELINNISKTKGMVQSGERIVMKGDIVNGDTFQILSSLKIEYEKFLGASEKHKLIVIGKILLILVCLTLMMLYLYSFRKRIYYNNKKFFFVFLIIILMCSLGTAILSIPYLDVLVTPLVLITIIIKNFMDGRTGIFALLCSTLIIGYIVPNSYEFVFMQISAGLIAIFTLNQLHRRGQLILTAATVFTTYVIIYLAFSITQEGDFAQINWYKLLWIGGNCFLLTLSYPLIYLFEKLFGFISDTTLIELSNSNHPLLRKLTQNAPGTFQHSLQVANLAEEAIYVIGGNPLLVRTGALYHDIGKMTNPTFFIENQVANTENPHKDLEFDESAKYITDHVKKGIEIAKKHNLPDQIIHFIKTHHGAGKALYFYNSFKNKYPDRKINEEIFTYPGPDPFSKETAVLMMADSVEAASRSLTEKTEETISKLVSDIIDKQLNDGRFNNVDITLRNLTEIKKIFTEMLININHVRIKYPKSPKENKATEKS